MIPSSGERFETDASDGAILAGLARLDAFVLFYDRDKDGSAKLGTVCRMIARIEIGEDGMTI